MCLSQLVLNAKVERICEIDQHLDWADNYGLSDDDIEDWDFCKKLKKEKEKLMKEVEDLKKC